MDASFRTRDSSQKHRCHPFRLGRAMVRDMMWRNVRVAGKATPWALDAFCWIGLDRRCRRLRSGCWTAVTADGLPTCADSLRSCRVRVRGDV